ncbi:MAG: 30S ribosomal protein S1 [Acidobacteria bacterium]|nr:30S ribosomal protein S1 [Acidobacteriota bacterium]
MTETDGKAKGDSSVPMDVPEQWLNLTSDNIGQHEPLDMKLLLRTGAPSQNEHKLLKGKVVAITPTDVLVDVGLKSEGIVPVEELTGPNGEVTVKPGDEVEVFIERLEDANGYVVLSKVKAQKMKAWEEVENAFKENRPIKGIILDRVKGGLAVDVGVRAFLPGSLVDLQPVRNLRALKGQEVELKVIKVNRKRGNIVLSRKAYLEERVSVQKEKILACIAEKKPLMGTVKNLTNFGAFIDLGGVDGLLHVTDMSWKRINHPSELFKVGDQVEVLILNYDEETGKLQLGYKQREPSPWKSVADKYPIGTKVNGKVISLTNYGAFIELEPGIEGMIHVSEMSWTKKVKHPSAVLEVGQEVEVVILDIDSEAQRISLGLKQASPNPWDIITEQFQVGDRVKGKVRNITDFGIFVEVLEGVDGLVHISDLSWKRVNHPSELIKKGDEVEAVIINIDAVNQRLSLSMKALMPDIWEEFFRSHYVGDVVTGTVTKLVDFGAFVDLGDGVEGLVHISELSDKHIQSCAEVVEAGKAYSFKIIRLEPHEKRIGLSLKDGAPRADEAARDAGSDYRPAPSDGRASLGDVLDLKDFHRDEEGQE